MKKPSVNVAGETFPRVFVDISPHYAYGWLWNAEGQRQIYLHDIEVVGERRKGIGRTMLRAFLEAGKRLDAEEFVTIPVTLDGAAFLNGVFQLAEPIGVCSEFRMSLSEATTRLEVPINHE